MPNCDWGKPCNCSECSTLDKDIICPTCGCKNHVVIKMDSQWVVDRKGFGYYDFCVPETEKQNIRCKSCNNGLFISKA